VKAMQLHHKIFSNARILGTIPSSSSVIKSSNEINVLYSIALNEGSAQKVWIIHCLVFIQIIYLLF